MTRALTKAQPRTQSDGDLCRHEERQRRGVEIRRVAVVQSRRRALQAAAGSGVTRGDGRMTIRGEPATSSLYLLTAPVRCAFPRLITGRPTGRPVSRLPTRRTSSAA